MTNTHEVLVKAKSLIERGWTKGKNSDGQGNYCLRAAISVAAGSFCEAHGAVTWPVPQNREEMVAALEAENADITAKLAVDKCLPEGFTHIVKFNDHPATTRNDVLQVLDKAISSC